MTDRTQPLPPGQFESEDFPRFGLTPFAFRYPRQVERVEVHVAGDVESPITITSELQDLERVEIKADFHCVTTWSQRGQDGYESSLPLADALASDVLPRYVYGPMIRSTAKRFHRGMEEYWRRQSEGSPD